MLQSVDQLTTIHHALSEAQQEHRGEEPLPTYTFRLSEVERNAATEVCKQHGTNLAAFLRACVRVLPRDYKP